MVTWNCLTSNDYVYNICSAAMNYLKLIDAINMQRELTNKDPWNVRIVFILGL